MIMQQSYKCWSEELTITSIEWHSHGVSSSRLSHCKVVQEKLARDRIGGGCVCVPRSSSRPAHMESWDIRGAEDK